MFSNFVINMLIAVICYLVFEKYNLKYNLENFLIVVLSYLAINKLLKKVEGFEDGESSEMESEEEPEMESEEQEPEMESEEQEDSPSMTEDIIDEISEEPQMESSVSEEPQMESSVSEEPQMESSVSEEPQIKEIVLKDETSEITPYTSEEMKKLQSKYTIMPVESWIKNEINLMSKSQEEGNKSCSCPTLSRSSNDYLEF